MKLPPEALILEVLDLDFRGYIIMDSIIISNIQEIGLAGSFPDPNILDPDKQIIEAGGLSTLPICAASLSGKFEIWKIPPGASSFYSRGHRPVFCDQLLYIIQNDSTSWSSQSERKKQILLSKYLFEQIFAQQTFFPTVLFDFSICSANLSNSI